MPGLTKTPQVRVSLTPLESLPMGVEGTAAGDQSFSCERCPMTFDSEKGLRIHFTWRHSKDPAQTALRCTECALEFTLKHEYHEHMGSVHGRTRTHVCKLCQKSYSWAQGLYVHMKTKHRDVADGDESGWETDESSASSTPAARIRKSNESPALKGEIGGPKRFRSAEPSSTPKVTSSSKQNGISVTSKQGHSPPANSSKQSSPADASRSQAGEVEVSASSNSTSSQAASFFYGKPPSVQEAATNGTAPVVVRRGRGRPRKIPGAPKKPSVEFNVARRGPTLGSSRSHSVVFAGRTKSSRALAGLIKCYACDKKFADAKLRLEHLLTMHAKINEPEVLANCQRCKTLKQGDLRTHVSSEHTQQCLVCDKVFIYSKVLVRHMAREHQRDAEVTKIGDEEVPNGHDAVPLQNGCAEKDPRTQSNGSAVAKKNDSGSQTDKIQTLSQSEEMLRKRNAFLEGRVREVAEENSRLSEELELLRGERVVTNGDAEAAHSEELVDLRKQVENLTSEKNRLVSKVLALRREGTDLRRKDFEMRRAFDNLNAEVRELKAKDAMNTLRLENAELRMRMTQPMAVMTGLVPHEKAVSTLILANATSLLKTEPPSVNAEEDVVDLVYIDSDEEDDDVQNVWQNDISMTIKDE